MSSSARPDRFGNAAEGAFRSFLAPLGLLLLAPPTVILLWMSVVHFDGSVAELWRADVSDIRALWPWPTWTAFEIIAIWALAQLALLVLLPGRTHLGPTTPRGNRPVYRLNGVAAFLVTHALFLVASYGFGWFSPSIVYDHFGEILATSNVVALGFCLLLYCKGRWFPSTSDRSATGNFVWDYFWGTELHPRIGSIELKQLVNCRIAMMGWSIILLSFCAKQYETTGELSNALLVSVGLQVAYIFKFFAWERGYFASLDIMHDRFGFYICWGVLVWLPGVYTLVGLYLATHVTPLSGASAWALAAMGLLALWINFEADEQRRRVRATDGRTTVWGREPAVLRAEYQTLDGCTHESLLLVSGWWGVARHFHYVPELLLALAWTLPAGPHHALPYFYVTFLTILLVDRSYRDELRCRGKYGPTWIEYCRRVPYRMLPYIY